MVNIIKTIKCKLANWLNKDHWHEYIGLMAGDYDEANHCYVDRCIEICKHCGREK